MRYEVHRLIFRRKSKILCFLNKNNKALCNKSILARKLTVSNIGKYENLFRMKLKTERLIIMKSLIKQYYILIAQKLRCLQEYFTKIQ